MINFKEKDEEKEKENGIIVTDEDTIEEDSNDGGIYPYDPAYTDIEIGEAPFSIFEYLRQLNKGKIKIQPDFQRNQVWTTVQKSRFIESVILNFPLPPIYLNETKDSTYIVIDGLQRTTALQEFYNGDFALTGIEALPKYNGRYFKEPKNNSKSGIKFDYSEIVLPEPLQSKFEDKKLTIFILKPSTPMVVIYDLFNRINTGGTQLNRQEVRNCIFIGKSTQLLKELSEENYFKKAIDWGVSDKRMKDREVVLRYLTFRWFDFKKEYAGNMSSFVEMAMKKINKLGDDDLQKMKDDFERVMRQSFLIWGNKNFRMPTAHTRGTINTAILESVCNYLSTKTNDFLANNKNIIKGNYDKLIYDETYYDSVSKSTGSKTKVLDRFKLAHKYLNEGTI